MIVFSFYFRKYESQTLIKTSKKIMNLTTATQTKFSPLQDEIELAAHLDSGKSLTFFGILSSS